HRSVCVKALGEAAESDSARGQLVHYGKNALGVASEAVKLPDGEHVAFAEMMFRAASRRTRCLMGWSIGPVHELRQLGAGVDAQLGERIVDVVFHRMQG